MQKVRVKPRPNDRNMPTQHANATCQRNMSQHVAPNNVAICCVGMLRSFGRGFKSDLKTNVIIKSVARGGVLPIMAYTGRLRPKGVPFSGFRYKKG